MSEIFRDNPTLITASTPGELGSQLRYSSEVDTDKFISFRSRSLYMKPDLNHRSEVFSDREKLESENSYIYVLPDEEGRVLKGRYIGTTIIAGRPEYPGRDRLMVVLMDKVGIQDPSDGEWVELVSGSDMLFNPATNNFEPTNPDSGSVFVVLDDVIPNEAGQYEASIVSDYFQSPESIFSEYKAICNSIDKATGEDRQYLEMMRDIRREQAAHYASQYLHLLIPVALEDMNAPKTAV